VHSIFNGRSIHLEEQCAITPLWANSFNFRLWVYLHWYINASAINGYQSQSGIKDSVCVASCSTSVHYYFLLWSFQHTIAGTCTTTSIPVVYTSEVAHGPLLAWVMFHMWVVICIGLLIMSSVSEGMYRGHATCCSCCPRVSHDTGSCTALAWRQFLAQVHLFLYQGNRGIKSFVW
jgi:hypothetical protein